MDLLCRRGAWDLIIVSLSSKIRNVDWSIRTKFLKSFQWILAVRSLQLPLLEFSWNYCIVGTLVNLHMVRALRLKLTKVMR